MAIELHDFDDSLFEKSFRKGLHKDGSASILETFGILIHTEDANLAVLATESLQTLEACLAIMKYSCGDMHRHFLTFTNTEFTPCTILIGASYIVGSLTIAEAQLAPINLFCHF